jgi:hypothetical protein
MGAGGRGNRMTGELHSFPQFYSEAICIMGMAVSCCACPLACSSDSLFKELLRYFIPDPGTHIFVLDFHSINLISALKLCFYLLTKSKNSATLTALDTWQGLKKYVSIS